MTEREAIQIVCAAAALAANGHERSAQILEAISILKKPAELCHICEMPVNGPGKSICSAWHPSVVPAELVL